MPYYCAYARLEGGKLCHGVMGLGPAGAEGWAGGAARAVEWAKVEGWGEAWAEV